MPLSVVWMGSLLENGWLRKTLHLDMDCPAKRKSHNNIKTLKIHIKSKFILNKNNLLVPLLWPANEILKIQLDVSSRISQHKITYNHLQLVLLNIVQVDLYRGLVIPETWKATLKNPLEITVELIIAHLKFVNLIWIG